MGLAFTIMLVLTFGFIFVVDPLVTKAMDRWL
jgi:hypothetical protein